MDSLKLARYIVGKCYQDGCSIDNFQLQPILFLIQKGFLQKWDKIAFDSDIEAWLYSPVVPDVYYDGSAFDRKFVVDINSLYSEEEIEMIDAIVEEHRLKFPWEMAKLVKGEDGAWDRVYSSYNYGPAVLSVEDIKKYG